MKSIIGSLQCFLFMEAKSVGTKAAVDVKHLYQSSMKLLL